MAQLEQNIQALRTVVQAQQTQLKTLQELRQSQPLLGLTTDQPWGMALEGLSVGVMAMALGAGALLALRAVPLPGRPRHAASTSGSDTSAEFSDSMLYLAAQDDAQESLPPVTTHLHDPQQDAKASTLAHEDGDPALEYHRMALTAQGLSVTAGAGHVDSDRVPLDVPPPLQTPPATEKDRYNIFSPSLSRAEFDQRAAAEEVERVRRYLAQRRADRARNTLGLAPTSPASPVVEEPVAASLPAPQQGGAAQVDIHLEVDTPAVPTPQTAPLPEPAMDVQWNDLLPSAPNQAAEPAQPVLTVEAPAGPDLGTLEHVALSDGASLLAALSEVELPASTDEALPPTGSVDAGAVFAEVVKPVSPPGQDGALLEWDLLPLGNAAATVAPTPANAVPFASDEPLLAAGHVQLALAQEFRDLGLWDEARARVLEILEQPDTGQHAQAKALLEELAQTAPVPLAKQARSDDPWF